MSSSPLRAPLTVIALACMALGAPAALAQPAARKQATPPAAPPNGGARDDAALNFVGADIESVIKAIGHYTNMTFIIDPRVKGTLTLVSEKPLSKAQAFSLLSSQLRLQGYAIVIGDGFAKVVPEADAKVQPGPTTVGSSAALKGDQIATQIFRLNYESPANMVTVLRPLVSPNNTINANPSNNTLVITDYADNLKRLGRIINALDAPGNSDIDVIPVRYAIAADLAAMVSRLLADNAAPGDAGRINLMADPRTNSLVLRAPSSARATLAKTLIAKLDQPTAQLGNVHVVYLKNAEATRLAQTLRAIVSFDSSAQSGSTSGASSPSTPVSGLNTSGTTTGTTSGTSSSAQPNTLPSGGAAGFIQADAATNTLIITASETVYRNLRFVVDQLDVRRAQVYIESLIVEVTAEKAAELGVQWLSLTGDSSSNYRIGSVSSSTVTGASNSITALATGNGSTLPGAGLTVGIFRQINGKLGLGALAHALASDANTNILSTPNLLTLDNEEAKIIVGQNVPFITGQYTSSSSSASTVNPFQTIERKDVGIQLTIRPQISEGGTVKMKIYQESSSVSSTVNAAGIITNKRSIDTNALADDGQILVLGGLIEDSTSDGVDSVPGLASLPLIGGLFRNQTHNRKKTNLMVFLRPTIIRGSNDNAILLNDRYEFIRGAELMANPERSSLLPDFGNPTLAPLQDGRPTGGLMLKEAPKRKSAAPAAPGDSSTAAPPASPADASAPVEPAAKK